MSSPKDYSRFQKIWMKKFGSKKTLGQKKFGLKKLGLRINFGLKMLDQKECWSNKKFGSKNYFG